jgi:hypothetical protein
MIKSRLSYFKWTPLVVLLALGFTLSMRTSTANIQPSPVANPAIDADLNAESRILDTFAGDLGKFDRKGVELAKRSSLTGPDLAEYDRQGDDLKRRLSEVQKTLRQIIIKLKAAGQWDNLDQTLLAKISDSGFQDFVRREGFKRTLEEAASGLSNNPNEILKPVDALRNRVQGRAQDSIFERGDMRVVRVSYTTAPAMFAATLRCRFARIRQGITGATSSSGHPSQKAHDLVDCFCDGNAVGGCERLAAT